VSSHASGSGKAKNEGNRDLPLTAEQEARALRLHRDATIVDGTALDYTLEGPYTEASLKAGLTAAVVTVFIGVERGKGDHTSLALRAVDRAVRQAQRPDGNIQLVLDVDDIARARAAGKLGVILAFQNATPLGDDARLVRSFWSMGLRCIQLTYNLRNLFADGCIEKSPGGVSHAGREVLAAMQETGILVDLSHVADPSVDEAIALAERPVAFTHCNARALCDNARNKTDAQIGRLTAKGGVIGLNAFPAFVRDDGARPWLADLLDHADHISQLVGSQALGLGLDFIEAWTDVEKQNLRAHPTAFGTQYQFPVGLEGVRELPNLTRGLVARNYDDAAIRGILGENYIDLFRRTWQPTRASS
jgi:membrane dipeptidase